MIKMLRIKFARNLKEYLSTNDISVRELSSRSGVSKTTILRYLNGESTPDLDKVEAISDALNVSAMSLIA